MAAGGNDTFAMGAALTAADSIDGGTGSDTLTLAGDYSAGLVFGAATITGIETLKLAGGNSYTLTTNDANVAAGAVLSVDGSALGGSAHLVFNGTARNRRFLRLHRRRGRGHADRRRAGRQFRPQPWRATTSAHGGGGNDTFLMGARADRGRLHRRRRGQRHADPKRRLFRGADDWRGHAHQRRDAAGFRGQRLQSHHQ